MLLGVDDQKRNTIVEVFVEKVDVVVVSLVVGSFQSEQEVFNGWIHTPRQKEILDQPNGFLVDGVDLLPSYFIEPCVEMSKPFIMTQGKLSGFLLSFGHG